MTERLYYSDPFLLEFDARVLEVTERDGQPAVVLDRSAFYPTSGGQLHDTGELVADTKAFNVVDVVEDEETGAVFHLLAGAAPAAGTAVRGRIDRDRRRDHMQQHTGQHVLSAAFERLYDMPTVSFHMGAESCTIDLDTRALSPAQLAEAARLANDVVLDDRPVGIRFATPDEARAAGVRKLPPLKAGQQQLRLIDIHDFDLNACGGTHVRATGQVGAILVRKTEKVKQGHRVEFVCGARALATAQRDFAALTDAAAAFTTHIWEVPAQVRKQLDETKTAAKARTRLLEELAALTAEKLLAETPVTGGFRLVARTFADRDLEFVKFLAHQLTADAERKCVALLASTAAQLALVFAVTPGLDLDAGALLKQAVTARGGRGGGSKQLAQGGVPTAADAEAAVSEVARTLTGLV